MSTNVSNLATPETGNIWSWLCSSLPGLLLVEVATAPSSLVCFISTLASLKTSSAAMFSIPANHCSFIEIWSGKPLMVILTVFSSLHPVCPTNPALRLISTAYTSTGSPVQVIFLGLL